METVAQTEAESKPRGVFLKVYDFLSSVKLAVVVFFLLAAGSISGTIIEQGLDPQEYITRYGEKWYYWINLLSLPNVYHSWWFTLLLALLAINLAVCLSKRLPTIWRAYSVVDCDFTHNLVQNFKNSTVIKFQGNAEEAKQKTLSILKRHQYKLWMENNPKGISIFAAKGRIGRLGSTLTHISIFIILSGTVVSSAIGYRTFYPVYEGTPLYIPQGNFYLVLDKFWIDYNEKGGIKDYFSKLSIIDKEKKVLTKTIQVNDPLQYKGVWFYQSSYGLAWDRIAKALIRITDKKSRKVITEEVLDFRKAKEIKGADLRLTVTNFVSHFAYDPKTKQVYSQSPEHENPAIQLEIVEGGQTIATPWLFYDPKLQGMFPIEKSKYDFVLADYRAPQYSGLQMAKDPGVNLVWVGSALLMAGLFISFFIFHRRLWIRIEPSEKSAIIYLGGLANKDAFGFEKEMKGILESF
ncbi:MAG: cytochrome c biogenesis protein ResB [Nitrospirae bacterium]|nr:cytochrome c biogenesis protein ResB [Nitrospirota bacterium]